MLSRADIVIAKVGKELDVDRDLILAPSRSSRNVAWARMVAVYIIRELTGASWSEIGRKFGRDRTTIRHAHERVSKTSHISEFLDRIKDECSASPL